MTRFHTRTEAMLAKLWRVSYLAFAIAASAGLAILFYGYQLQENSHWQYVVLLVQNIIILIAALVCADNARRGEISNMWDIVRALQVIYLFGAFFSSGLGWWYGITIAGITLSIAVQLPRERVPQWTIISGAALGVLTLLIDLYWPLDRLNIFARQPIMPYIIFGLLYAALAYAGLDNFPNRSIKAKLLVTFALISAIIAVPVILYLIYSTRQTLVTQENQKLLTTAQQAAKSLYSFTENNRSAIASEAKLDDFVQFVSMPPTQRSGSEEETHALSILTTLTQKDKYVVSYEILDQYGTTLLDTTTRNVGLTHATDSTLAKVVQEKAALMSNVTFEASSQSAKIGRLAFGAPIIGESGSVLGILRVQYDASVLQNLIREYNDQAGLTSFAILVDENNLRLAHGRSDAQVFTLLAPLTNPEIQKLQQIGRLPGLPQEQLATDLTSLAENLKIYRTAPNTAAPFFTTEIGESTSDTNDTSEERVAVYGVKDTSWLVLVAQNEEMATAPLRGQTRVISLMILAIVFILTPLSLLITNFFNQPIVRLTEATGRIVEGDYNIQLPVITTDEFGTLSRAFNQMANQIRQSVVTLADRVTERTRDLEYQASQVQSALEIGNVISSIRNLEGLLPKVTQLVSERFNFYHVGIFLLDEQGKYAVLRAANSPGGQRMLARGHRLGIGETGIVGYAVATGQPRIALNVGQDDVYYNNPDLPNTRSEMAVPLVVAGKVLGAMDIQSVKPDAFTEADIAVLRVVADHVAVAVENARLFAELENALEGTRKAYGEVSKTAWKELVRQRANAGFLCNRAGEIIPVRSKITSNDVSETALPEIVAGNSVQLNNHTLVVPVIVRNSVAGAIRLQKGEAGYAWNENEVALVKSVVDQLGVALENARLYRETQINAARDRLVGEVTDRMRRSIDMDSLLKTAVGEMSRILGVKEAFIQFTPLQTASRNTPPGAETTAGNGHTPHGNGEHA